MPLDGISTHLLAQELNDRLSGARVDKIYQPDRFNVYFTVRTNAENVRLLLCCDPQSPRIQLTDNIRENPQMPPNFCMLLRKYLQGARILRVECPNFERMISISFSVTDELQDISEKRLIIEMMGRYSNIIFLNTENRIIDALVHVDDSNSRVREIMPARIYEAPPQQGKISPIQAKSMLDQDELPILPTSTSRPTTKALLDSLLGFSPLLANDICFQAEIDPRKGFSVLSDSESGRLRHVLEKVLEDICLNKPSPTIFYVDGQPADWHALALKDAGISEAVSSLSHAMDRVYGFQEARKRFENRRRRIRGIITAALSHASKKLDIHEDDIRATADAEELKKQGELILAYQYLIKPDDKVLSIPDYPDFGQTTSIELMSGMTASAQGQLYLKRYRKAVGRRESAMRFLSEEKEEVAYLQSLIQATDAASENEDLDALDYEIASLVSDNKDASPKKQIEKTYHPGKSKSGKASSRALRQAAQLAQSKNKRNQAKKKSQDPSSPRQFHVADGFEVLSGRNNIQNDQLTFHTAEKDDLWFHVKNMPGTHVILRTMGKEPTDQAILQAASIAAYYSRNNKAFSKDQSESKTQYDIRVEIDYCPVSHVKKIPKAKPGIVIYNEYSTLLVSAKLPTQQESQE